MTCAALAKSFIFANLERDAVDAMVREMYSINVPAGTTLTEEGHSGDAMYLVQSGEFSAVQTRLGTEITIQTFAKGDMVGELGLLTRTKRMMTVRANQRSRVWVCTRQTFKSEIKHSVEKPSSRRTSFWKTRLSSAISRSRRENRSHPSWNSSSSIRSRTSCAKTTRVTAIFTL